MTTLDCPVDVLTEARRLASQIEGQDLPLSYDPGDLGWDQNLLRIRHIYTNYEALSEELEDWLVAQLERTGVECELRSPSTDLGSGQRCPNCADHWVARHELSDAARKTAERLCQRWLARKGLADRRARRQ